MKPVKIKDSTRDNVNITYGLFELSVTLLFDEFE